jgi:hypothetical protein
VAGWLAFYYYNQIIIARRDDLAASAYAPLQRKVSFQSAASHSPRKFFIPLWQFFTHEGAKQKNHPSHPPADVG